LEELHSQTRGEEIAPQKQDILDISRGDNQVSKYIPILTNAATPVKVYCLSVYFTIIKKKQEKAHADINK